MFFINFCFLMLITKFKRNTYLFRNNNQKNMGFDKRYPNKTDFNPKLNYKISEFFIKYNLLKELKKNDLSNHKKLELIETYDLLNNSKPINLEKGSLMDDYNFDIYS